MLDAILIAGGAGSSTYILPALRVLGMAGCRYRSVLTTIVGGVELAIGIRTGYARMADSSTMPEAWSPFPSLGKELYRLFHHAGGMVPLP